MNAREVSRILSLFLTLVLALTACVGSASSSQPAAPDSPAGQASGTEASQGEAKEPVTLEYAFWGDDYVVQQKIKAAEIYMAENPHVTLEYTYASGVDYQTKMQTWFSSGVTPDIISTAADILVPYLDTGSFMDLTPLVEADGLRELWMPELLDFFTHKGELLSVPNLYNTQVLAYNKTLFDEAGVPYPENDDWSEEEFFETLEALKNGLTDPEYYALHIPYAYPLIMYRRLYGDPGIYDMDTMNMTTEGNEKFRHAFETLANLTIEGYMPYTTASRSAVQGGFETGKYAIGHIGYGAIPTLRDQVADNFEWDLVAWPVNTQFNTRWQTVVFPNGYGIYKDCENAEAAWDFIKFLTTDPRVAEIDSENGIPALMSVQNDPAFMTDYNGCKPFRKEVFVNALEDSTTYASIGIWAQVNDLARDEFNRCIEGKTDFDTAIETITRQGQDIFDSNR